MELEMINKSYTRLKTDIKMMNQNIKGLENQLGRLEDDKIIYKGKMLEAKKNGDVNAQKQAQNEIKKIDDQIKIIKSQASLLRDDIKLSKEKINERMEQIKKDPEMKKHLDVVMAKKYGRKLEQLKKEKNELEGKRDRLPELEKLVNDHPSLGNDLKAILGATKEVNDLKNELEKMTIIGKGNVITYKDPNRANDIMKNLLPNLQDQIKNRKKPLMDYINKKGLNITEKDIDDFAENGFIANAKGIDLNKTMTKYKTKLNREIKGHDKSIKDYTVALNGLPVKISNQSQQQNQNSQQQGQQQAQPQQNSQQQSQQQAQSQQNSQQQNQQQTQSQEEPKWYQFGKRFKNWLGKRKQKSLPQGQTQGQTQVTVEEEDKKNTFRNSLKYEVVQDIVDNIEQHDLKEAKKERKSQKSQNMQR